MPGPARMITAGVYVNVGGLFPFQVGPTKRGDTLGVVRLGGHREADETGWQCAKREAFEEAKLHESSEEAKGLLLLKPADIARIVRGTLALRDYLDIGGEAIFGEDIPAQLVLEPFPHLRFLAQLIQLHPEIATWTGEAG